MIKLIISRKPAALSDFRDLGILLDFDIRNVQKDQVKILTNNQEMLFGNPISYFIDGSLLTKNDLTFIINNGINILGTITKNTLSSSSELIHDNDIDIFTVDDTSTEHTPWNLVQTIFSKSLKFNENDLIYFSSNENNFRFLMNLLEKDYLRFLMLQIKTPDKLSKLMAEKVDFRYEVAKRRLGAFDEERASKFAEIMWKIDNVNSREFDPDSTKRALIALSYL